MVGLLYLPSVVSRVHDESGRADALDNLRRKETLDDGMGARNTKSMNELTKRAD
jgi:hypothetical protein